MAEEKNPFLDGLDSEENPFLSGLDVPKGPPEGVKPLRTEPLSDMERFIFQNLFDTDKKRREAYAKSIGLEIDPSDDNKFRALGSKEVFTGEIDPGFIDEYKKGGLVAVAKELGKDVLSDMAVDYGIGGLSAAAAVPGAKAGALAGPVGAVMGGLISGFGGAMAGEEIKEFMGDLMIDEDIPSDQKQQVLFSTMNALGPVIGKQIGTLGKKGYQTFLNLRKDAIKQALKQGGQLSEEAIDKAMKQPELFQQEVVKDGTKRLDEFYGQFFGVKPDEVDIQRAVRDMAEGTPKGRIGEMLKPVYEQRNRALAELNADRAADFTIEELRMPLTQKIVEIKSKPFLSVDEKDALNVLSNQIKDLDTYAKTLVPKGADIATANNVRVPFQTGQDFLKSFQSAAFDKATKQRNPIVDSVAGKMRVDVIQAKGSKVNPAFADAQAKISRATEVFEDAAKTLKPDTIRQAFVLDPSSDNRRKVGRALSQIDEITGQDISKQFEKGALQSQMELIYSRASPTGSSNVNTAITKGAASGAFKGGLTGATVGAITPLPMAATVPTGAIIGGIRGAQQAATLAQPGKALQKLADMTQREQFLEFISQKAAQAGGSLPGQAVQSAVAEEMTPEFIRESVTEKEEENPFLRGL